MSDYEEYSKDHDFDFKTFKAPKHIALEAKHSTKINEAMLKKAQAALPNNIVNSLKTIEKRQEASRIRVKDKSDRATVELVLDSRTRLILYKMINTEKISQIFGCVSAGKEANVYYAVDSENQEFALKIYKTSILVFKDRNRYVEGEFRFRKGYSKHNPRRMVKMWAEKEMRNLKRLNSEGIPSPEPLLVKQNVLLMKFLGLNGDAAPRLKDVVFGDRVQEFYKQTAELLRKLYQNCHLVHADFSEYNLLYHQDTVHVIDVSQAVEHDHPHALYFLRRDCANINSFFQKQGAEILSVQALFHFITDLTELSWEERWAQALEFQDSIGDEVFKEIYIPRTLQEIDLDEESSQRPELFGKLTGIKDQEEVDSESSEEEEQPKKAIGDVIYTGMTKLERKLKVKEDKKEKRQNKIPKQQKNLKVRKTARKHRNIK